MHTVETCLGRNVFIDDWEEFQGDVVLKMLYDYSSTSGGQFDSDYKLSRESIFNGSAMSIDEVPKVIAHLNKRGLVIIDGDTGDVWLTNLGFSFVHDRPWDRGCPTCGRR